MSNLVAVRRCNLNDKTVNVCLGKTDDAYNAPYVAFGMPDSKAGDFYWIRFYANLSKSEKKEFDHVGYFPGTAETIALAEAAEVLS